MSKNILLVYPMFPPSFWSFEGAMEVIDKKALLPPLGLITIAAICPQSWNFRLVDTNCEDVSEDDWAWADLMLMSGMIVQKQHMLELIAEAKSHQKPVAVGGPFATSVPSVFSEAGAEFLVLDEGEITIPFFVEALERGDTSGTFNAENDEKADMTTSPVPRYDLLNMDHYAEMSLQFSRGCPFMCEFCDIIILYGRRPRTKTPKQIIAELQCLYDLGWRRSIFVVDDNFIGNKRTVAPVVEAMEKWQRAHQFPFTFATEASINLADDVPLMTLMHSANFITVFIGIETPDVETLKFTKKTQNTRHSMTDQINTIAANGLRVMGGFIIGFDGETKGAGERISDFIEEAAVPIAIISMLQALPNTHLSQRLKREGRLFEAGDEGDLNSSSLTNFLPTRPLSELAQEHTDTMWRLYEPATFIARSYRHSLVLGRIPKQKARERPRWNEVRAAATILWRHGVARPTRGLFWKCFLDIRKKNPTGLRSFVISCAHFEHLYRFRHTVRDEITAQVADLPEQLLSATYSPPAPATERESASA